jgi:hypothetical protein
MNIRDRLSLSARPGKIAFIREGLFLRCYQQSLFSLLRLQQEVRVLGRQFKNLEGQWVFYAGFPADRVMQRLPYAKEMVWGFEVESDDIMPDECQNWVAEMIQNFESKDTNAKTEEVLKGRILSQGRQVYLSTEACCFLSLWQPGMFPSEVDAGFIEGLRRSWGFDGHGTSDST